MQTKDKDPWSVGAAAAVSQVNRNAMSPDEFSAKFRRPWDKYADAASPVSISSDQFIERYRSPKVASLCTVEVTAAPTAAAPPPSWRVDFEDSASRASESRSSESMEDWQERVIRTSETILPEVLYPNTIHDSRQNSSDVSDGHDRGKRPNDIISTGQRQNSPDVSVPPEASTACTAVRVPEVLCGVDESQRTSCPTLRGGDADQDVVSKAPGPPTTKSW